MKTNFEANVELWRNCNFNCSFCIGAKLPAITEWKEYNKKLDILYNFFKNTGIWKLMFLGGEVFINPYFSKICKNMIDDGHKLSFISNGSIKLDSLFEEKYIERFEHLEFSYHPIHEQSEYYNNIFIYNLKLMKKLNVNCNVVYVVTPDRIEKIRDIKLKLNNIGINVTFSPLYGEFGGKDYPSAYNKKDLQHINNHNKNLGAMYKFENISIKSTFRKCRAGYNKFSISIGSGNISQCEQFSNKCMFNIYNDNISEFRNSIYKRPITCMSNNCVCGLHMELEEFFRKNRYNDIEKYEELKLLCSYNKKALNYWENEEKKFGKYILESLEGTEIFIWGGGIHTVKLLSTLDRLNVHLNIKGIIDSDKKKDGQKLKDIEIINKDRFFMEYKNNCTDIIISSRAFEDEIYNEAKKMFENKINLVKIYNNNKINNVPI